MKKIAPDGADTKKQTERQTDMATESAQWGRLSEKDQTIFTSLPKNLKWNGLDKRKSFIKR